jgi:hypothetical protein
VLHDNLVTKVVHADLVFVFSGVLVNEVKLEQVECNQGERAYWFGLSTFPLYHNLIAAIT